MITNYNFKKKIKQIDSVYNLEINIPNILNNFYYRLYGSEGFYQNGKFSSYKNINTNNVLVFCIDKIQIIYINIKVNNKIEYFDFFDMLKNSNNIFTKNIKIDIKRKNNDTNKENDDNDDEDNDVEDNDDEDNDVEDNNDEDSEDEDSNDEGKSELTFLEKIPLNWNLKHTKDLINDDDSNSE